MFDDLPCSSDGCMGSAPAGRDTCDICYDWNGYPEGWSRSRDEAWLEYRSCEEIRRIPIPRGGP